MPKKYKLLKREKTPENNDFFPEQMGCFSMPAFEN